MDWEEALNLVVQTTGHARYRDLCAEEHPDRDAWRARMIARATGEAVAPTSYPSVATMAGNVLAAAGRAVAALATGGPVWVPNDVYEARRATCAACPEWVAKDRRCRLCGCQTDLKLRGAQESCPADPPRWGRWENPDPASRIG